MSTLLTTREELFWPFRQQFDKLFDRFFESDSLNAVKGLSKSGYPKLDAFLEGNQYRIQASVPGVKLSDLKVEIVPLKVDGADRKVLKVSGKMEDKFQSPQEAVYHVRELRRSYFERALLLPDILIGDPDAELKDGLFTLSWLVQTKQQDDSKVKLISVKEIA
jgi:HSP20 family molecular chaperone IbpA